MHPSSKRIEEYTKQSNLRCWLPLDVSIAHSGRAATSKISETYLRTTFRRTRVDTSRSCSGRWQLELVVSSMQRYPSPIRTTNIDDALPSRTRPVLRDERSALRRDLRSREGVSAFRTQFVQPNQPISKLGHRRLWPICKSLPVSSLVGGIS